MQPAVAHPYDLAFASLPEPTLLVDADGHLTRMNAAAEALLGRASAAAAGEPLALALPWLAPAAERVLAGAADAGLEAEVETADGRRHVAARLRRMTSGGVLRGVVAVLEDLTDRRAVEARLRAAERLAALGTLAAGIAHEVNSPLACVVAGLSFVEAEHDRLLPTMAGADLGEARAALEEARAAARRVGRIMRSLQSLGGPAQPLLGEVDLAETVRTAARLTEHELRGRGRLVLELAEGLTLRGNESLLVELFAALLTNAAQALPEGGTPEAHQVRVTLLGGKGEARVVVTDTGAGSAEALGERVFEAFVTSHPDERDGFGLSVCHGIVTAFGGTLALAGTPGHGTTAVVRLPLA
jgi:two-component system, NtrC family, sensor kinase